MLRKLLALILALLLCAPAVLAEDDPFASLNIPPTEAIIQESEFLRIESVYYPEQNVTRSVATLTGNPAFANAYIKPFGTIFLNLIKWIVCPLVFFSIMAGVVSMLTSVAGLPEVENSKME